MLIHSTQVSSQTITYQCLLFFVDDFVVPAYIAEKEAAEQKRAAKIAERRAQREAFHDDVDSENESEDSDDSKIDFAALMAEARGKGAREYISDDYFGQFKSQRKKHSIGKEVSCKKGAASSYINADKTSVGYDLQVMKRRSTQPKPEFPDLQNSEVTKYTYYTQSVTYIDTTLGHIQLITVENRSTANSLACFMRSRYSKFGPKQNTNVLNTYELKANRWEGIPCKSPHVCFEYPTCAFQCPTLANFQCGPKTCEPLVKSYCSLSYLS